MIVDRLPRVVIISGTPLILPLSQLHNVAHIIKHINMFSALIGPSPHFNKVVVLEPIPDTGPITAHMCLMIPEAPL